MAHAMNVSAFLKDSTWYHYLVKNLVLKVIITELSKDLI